MPTLRAAGVHVNSSPIRRQYLAIRALPARLCFGPDRSLSIDRDRKAIKAF
jgi:hypothetical protein